MEGNHRALILFCIPEKFCEELHKSARNICQRNSRWSEGGDLKLITRKEVITVVLMKTQFSCTWHCVDSLTLLKLLKACTSLLGRE